MFAFGYMNAGVIHDNGPPDHAEGWEITSFVQADDFTLQKAARFEAVTFWVAEAGPFEGSIYWEIYSNSASDSPGTRLYSGTTNNLSHVATGITVFPVYPEFVITFNITPVNLPPGVYWLALHNGPLSHTTPLSIYWEGTPGSGARASQEKFVNTDTWYDNIYPGLPSELAFQMFGVMAPDIAILAVQNNGPHISFTTTAGYNYQVEYKNSLADQSWAPLPGAEFIAGTGNIVQVIDSDASQQALRRRFYRARLL
jgi:hypothetical protein